MVWSKDTVLENLKNDPTSKADMETLEMIREMEEKEKGYPKEKPFSGEKR